MPTLDELQLVLDRLETCIADDLESDVLDFKPWLPDPKDNLRTAVEYTSCLANHQGGLIVFGVRDQVRGLEKRGRKRGVTYHLTPHAARALQGPAVYSRILGIGELKWPELVRAYVEQHGSVTNAECRELLGLGSSKTARNQASTLLARLEFLERSGTGKGISYGLKGRQP